MPSNNPSFPSKTVPPSVLSLLTLLLNITPLAPTPPKTVLPQACLTLLLSIYEITSNDPPHPFVHCLLT